MKNFITTGHYSKHIEKDGDFYTLYSFVDTPVINPVDVALRSYFQAEICLIEKFHANHSDYAYSLDSNCEKDEILTIVEWMLANYKKEVINGEEMLRFHYDFDFPKLNLEKPWFSGMAQGLMIVNFLAAYELTGDTQYLDAANLSAIPLFIDMNDGGTRVEHWNGGVWFEEYASPMLEEGSSALVLNGNNFAIDALFWLSHYDLHRDYNSLYIESLESLSKNLKYYSSFAWSYYDDTKEMASFLYHDIHIEQLRKIIHFYCDAYECGSLIDDIISSERNFTYHRIVPLGMLERLLFQRNNMVIAIIFINFMISLCIIYLYRRFVK